MISLPHHFTPRPYQVPFLRAMDDGCRRAVLVHHRRAGKDKLAFNFLAKEMFSRVGNYYYFFPTYNQGRKILWDGKDKDGFPFLNHIPVELRFGDPNNTEMKLQVRHPKQRGVAGSLLQVVGSDNIDSIVGTNPVGCVFSEFSLQDPKGWDFVRPILRENGGWAVFVYTPRGKNHGYDLAEMAKRNAWGSGGEWFLQRLTVEDTFGQGGTMGPDDIESERRSGMSENLIQQEFYCNFDAAVENAVFGDQVFAARRENRVCRVPWEPRAEVETYWDIGWDDQTAIWFVQQVGKEVRLIDYYEARLQNLEGYIKVLREKPYVYARHVMPHDAGYKDMKLGKSTQEIAAELGLRVDIGQKLNKEDQIQNARSLFPRCWFDEDKCGKGFDALSAWHFSFDTEKRVLGRTPVHDWASHACFTADTNVLIRNGTNPPTVCPISTIPDNGKVLTPCGWKPYTRSWITRTGAPLVEVRFAGGYTVKCTPDHLFLTDSGWKFAESLTPGSQIRSTLTPSHSTLMAVFTRCGRARDTFLAAARSFIEKCGPLPLGRCLMDAISIIKTPISSITASQISNACRQTLTSRCPISIASLASMQEAVPQNGTPPMKAVFGTVATPSARKTGRSGSGLKNLAATAASYLSALSGKAGITRCTAVPPVAWLSIESVSKLTETADVWCLNVPDGQCFSLENGAVVHNSDAFCLIGVELREKLKHAPIKYPAMGYA